MTNYEVWKKNRSGNLNSSQTLLTRKLLPTISYCFEKCFWSYFVVFFFSHNLYLIYFCSAARTPRLLRSRVGTPNSIPDSPCSWEGRKNGIASQQISRGSIRPPRVPAVTNGYESDDSFRIDKLSHGVMMQDVSNIKSMLLKLKRVLHEVSSTTT